MFTLTEMLQLLAAEVITKDEMREWYDRATTPVTAAYIPHNIEYYTNTDDLVSGRNTGGS